MHPQQSPDPVDAASHYALGRSLEAQNRIPEAAESYRRAIALDPRHAKAHNNLGVMLHIQGQVREALECYRRARELDPDLPEANQNYASIARDPEAMARSVDGFLRELAAHPDDAVMHNNLGNAYRELGRNAEAARAYEKAIALDPDYADAHFHLAHVLLQSGDYARGWREYEWRLRTPLYSGPAQRFSEPVWHGRETALTVLLHAEQGFGDAIQFARYARAIAPRCGAVILECQPELKTLFDGLRDAPQVIARGDPLPPFGMHAPLMSLPAILGTTLETIPWSGPYLTPLPVRLINWRRAFRKRRKRVNVGLCWAGRPQHWDDLNRSIALSQFAPLAGVPDVAFFSLQKGEASAQAATPPAGMHLEDLSSKMADFADTAALIAFLDLVITVDTSVAHLAGALGRPTWLLLPRSPDWRWHLGRSDNPWYPTMKLFRQERDGDWAGVMERVALELAGTVAKAEPEKRRR